MRGRPKGHITALMSLPGCPRLGRGHVQVAAEPLLTRLPVTCQSYFWNVETGSERRREDGCAGDGSWEAAGSGWAATRPAPATPEQLVLPGAH